jgi:hypothetical protein
MRLENKLCGSIQELRSDMLRLNAELNTKIDRRFAELEGTMERKCAEERSKAELVLWTLLIMLGNIAFTVGASAVLSAFGHDG